MWYLMTNYIIGKNLNNKLENIIPKSNNMQWTSDIDSICTTLTFDSVLDLAEGRSHVELRYGSSPTNYNIVFQGVITQKVNKRQYNSYTVQDYGFYLNKNTVMYQANKVSGQTAINQLIKPYGMSMYGATLKTNITRFWKNKTPTDIIKEILSLCPELGTDYVMEVHKYQLYIQKCSALKLTDVKYKLQEDLSVTRSMEDMNNAVIVTSNSDTDTKEIAKLIDSKNIKTFGLLSYLLTVENATTSQAVEQAKNWLKAHDSVSLEISINIVDAGGCWQVKAGRMLPLVIKEYGINGTYKIKSAQHSLAGYCHTIQVTLDCSVNSGADTAISSSSALTINSSSSSSKADKVVAYAQKFLGVKYVWGGKTPSGFDCSGFVSYVFKNSVGVNLTAYTKTMATQGKTISKKNAMKGDIVFFDKNEHVGILVDGDHFIHAPHTGDVVKISQFSGYYSQNCNKIIRVL